ncbi:MAG: CoA-binding protein [Chloroflexi bacterium]|nr:CoA-binding protein [Chloroflexota bacterium]
MSTETASLEDLIRDFTGRRVWALVGATNNPRKYGNRILRDLRRAGYIVYAVNKSESEVDGQPAYRALADLPERPDVVDFVVPPNQTEQVVRECKALGLMRVWMQPGAESEAAIQYCHANGIQVIHDACAMVEKKQW